MIDVAFILYNKKIGVCQYFMNVPYSCHGYMADITVMELMQGDYIFCDGHGGERMNGNLLLEPRMVFKGGEEMPAYSRYHIPPLFT